MRRWVLILFVLAILIAWYLGFRIRYISSDSMGSSIPQDSLVVNREGGENKNYSIGDVVIFEDEQTVSGVLVMHRVM